MATEKQKAYQREYYQKHKQEKLAYAAQYRADNPEKIAASLHKWYVQNAEKVAATSKLWRQDNRERVNETTRNRRRKNPDKHRSYNRRYAKAKRDTNPELAREVCRMDYAKNQPKRLSDVKARQKALRMEVLSALGGKCACCGESTYEFLAIDHVNNDGAKHRKEVPARQLPLWLKKNNYPPGFQVLCHNCNVAKGLYKACPHARGTD